MLLDVLHPKNQRPFPKGVPNSEKEAKERCILTGAMGDLRDKLYPLLNQNDPLMTRLIEKRGSQKENSKALTRLQQGLMDTMARQDEQEQNEQEKDEPEDKLASVKTLSGRSLRKVIAMLLSGISATFPYTENEKRLPRWKKEMDKAQEGKQVA